MVICLYKPFGFLVYRGGRIFSGLRDKTDILTEHFLQHPLIVQTFRIIPVDEQAAIPVCYLAVQINLRRP